LIDWCLMPTLAVFQLYCGVNKFNKLKLCTLYGMCIVTVIQYKINATFLFNYFIFNYK
jgi:hypothetical protein